MKQFKLKDLLMQTMIAAIYVVLVYVFQFASFGLIQFRVAEVLMILVLFDKKHAVGLTIGCFLANWLGNAIVLDIFVGPLGTLLAAYLMVLFKKKLLISLMMPALANGLVVGMILTYGYVIAPLYITIPAVMIGELGVLYVLGLPMYLILKNHEYFQEIFKQN